MVFSRKMVRGLNPVSGSMKASNGVGLSGRPPSQLVRHSSHNRVLLCNVDKKWLAAKGRDGKYFLFGYPNTSYIINIIYYCIRVNSE